MAHTTIKRILSVQQLKDVWITTIEDEEGNIATGVGKDYEPHTPIITYFDDRYNKCKFTLDTNGQ